MSVCRRPIDPMDAQALAAGADPVFDSGAGDHWRICSECGDQVAQAGRLVQSLDEIPGGVVAEDLAARVIRVRAFSRRELRDLSLWRAPAGLCAGVFVAGLVTLTLPALTLHEQAGLGGMAVVGPLWTLMRAAPKLLSDLLAASPSGLQALSEVLRQQGSLGLGALALLLPASLGLSRALARSRR